MTSLARQISRRAARNNGVTLTTNPQFTILKDDGGYVTLHPTKGWRKVSGKRLKGR